MAGRERKIISIDSDKCTGCGQCIPNCPEGALQVIDGKARLISDLFCDGLGACIGHCPEGAITIEQRPAEPYDEAKVMENIIKQGDNVIRAHLRHLKEHNQKELFYRALEVLKKKNIVIYGVDPWCEIGHKGHGDVSVGCPGSRAMDFRGLDRGGDSIVETNGNSVSQLRQWPVQISLVSPRAPYFQGADLLVAADCTPFACADFHRRLLRGKILLVGCPKLDDVGFYREKIARILRENDINSITCAHMEVPCCFGLVNIVKGAIADSGKNSPFKEVTIALPRLSY